MLLRFERGLTETPLGLHRPSSARTPDVQNVSTSRLSIGGNGPFSRPVHRGSIRKETKNFGLKREGDTRNRRTDSPRSQTAAGFALTNRH